MLATATCPATECNNASCLMQSAGHSEDAAEVYKTAMMHAPVECPLKLYLWLGKYYAMREEHEYARNVFVQVSPSSAALLPVQCYRLFVMTLLAPVDKATWEPLHLCKQLRWCRTQLN